MHIDPFRKIFWRKHARGPLSGFYAATTLSGNQAVAVYDEHAAYVISIADAVLAVPLPPGAAGVALSVVNREGNTSAPVAYELIDGEVVFEARRCVGDVQHYRIAYALKTEAPR